MNDEQTDALMRAGFRKNEMDELVGELRRASGEFYLSTLWGKAADALERQARELAASKARVAGLEQERDKYYAWAVALFWGGSVPGDVTAGQVREAADKISAALASPISAKGEVG